MVRHAVIRVDSSAAIGAGHAIRCLSLASELIRRGAKITFAMRERLPGFERDLDRLGVSLSPIAAADDGADASALLKIARERAASLIVLDGYRFDASYRERLKDRDAALMVIDDLGDNGPYLCDVLHNQNVTSRAGLYDDLPPRATLLLGPRHALLRGQFLDLAPPRRYFARHGARILVTFGGTDPMEMTIPAIRALDRLKPRGLAVTVVAGPGFKRLQAIRAAGAASRHRVRLLMSPKSMAAAMADNDLLITAGGTTLWEAAYMGLPAIAIVVADNQEPGAATFTRLGCGVALDARRGLNRARLAALAERFNADGAARIRAARAGRALVDGHGAARVADALGF